ncbi:hypothetical protein [Mesorhizobium sp.]|uniref:hypothetical protein n=1 Tax=Mesorhizobium sp. TaxID=1871066 RepID=UPI0025C36A35|nr:hypothetical protein [Mesorhizobium sp.]
MTHFKEALIIAAFVFLFYSALDFSFVRSGFLKEAPKPLIGGLAGILAIAFVKLYLLPA